MGEACSGTGSRRSRSSAAAPWTQGAFRNPRNQARSPQSILSLFTLRARGEGAPRRLPHCEDLTPRGPKPPHRSSFPERKLRRENVIDRGPARLCAHHALQILTLFDGNPEPRLRGASAIALVYPQRVKTLSTLTSFFTTDNGSNLPRPPARPSGSGAASPWPLLEKPARVLGTSSRRGRRAKTQTLLPADLRARSSICTNA